MLTNCGILISDHAFICHNDIMDAPTPTPTPTKEATTTTPTKAYTLYAWVHKHEKTSKTVVLIAIDGKLEKKAFKKLSDTLKTRYNAHYSKFMKAFVVYPDDIKTIRSDKRVTIHRKAPTWYRGK